MLDASSSFHKLWVIESLKDGELKTGRKLVDGPLFGAALRQPDLKLEYRTPESKNDFLQLLELIRAEAANHGAYPMLHLECHGCKDGLQMKNGDLVGWESLRSILIEINSACRANLVITVAACDGAHLIKVAARLDRAPFWALIATEGAVSAGALQDDFGAFYTEFFDSLNGDAAIAALNRGVPEAERRYRLLTAAGLFARAYRKYHERYCVGSGKHQRVENLVTQAMKQPVVKKMSVNRVRKHVKQQLSQEERHFENHKRKFFFLDKFPENATRYSFTYNDVLNPK